MKQSQPTSNVDFDAEGRALWARLNLDKSSQGRRQWNPLDPIWRHPATGGTIYVGNQSAAEELGKLQSYGITHVVNCTAGQGSTQIPNYHEGKLKYYRFPVHCLAGAHRAGTTGILCLMNYADLDPASAIRLAKLCRPVIDPIAHLPELLDRFHRVKTADTAEQDDRMTSSSKEEKS